jgi:3-phosphoshikimate 1-carboxyvinyltransferase
VRRAVGPGRPLVGECSVPGDKSITHRALLFGAIASGDTVVQGYLESGDSRATIGALTALGVSVEPAGTDRLVVHGRGLQGLHEPDDVVDCLGSGTTMRLLAGLVSGCDFTTVLTGRDALRRRPMDRVVEPLRRMGARIIGRSGGRLAPLAIGGGNLHGIEYDLPVASAQVKSALLLAGLQANGPTMVTEPAPTRDHSERMLRAMGVAVESQAGRIRIEPADMLRPLEIAVPGDLSSAAFLVAAALLVSGSRLRLNGVGINPTRAGFIDIARAMGGEVTLENACESGGEPVADIVVSSCSLRGVRVQGALIPLAIDELPLVAVLGTQAEGVTEVREAAELRVKESDRIAGLVHELRALGARIEELPDGYLVEGPTRLHGGRVEAHGDHRLAMCLAIAGLVADGPVEIEGAEIVSESFPAFFDLLENLRQ